MARERGRDAETTRAGLATLISGTDFTTNHDPETVAEHQVFEIHVDWELFAANRIHIQHGAAND